MTQNIISGGPLEDLLTDQDPAMIYMNRIRTKFNLGTDIVGAVMAKRQALFDAFNLSEISDRIVYAPGDRSLNFGDNQNYVKVGLGMPIAYDIWYVFPAGNILEFGGKSVEDSMEKMASFFEVVDDAKPLCLCEHPPDPGPYTIKEARFENWQVGASPNFDSDRPKTNTQDYVGYIAFPIGPLGVMWGVSIATQSSLGENGVSSSVHPVSASNEVLAGGKILPPFDLDVAQIFGEELMSKGWIVSDENSVELYARPFEGQDNASLHKWLRYWIREDNTVIVPGEFVGLMCRPWPLHCWWYQETAPFVYSGTWMETEFYTSGIVKEVMDPEDDGEVGNRYRIWVKNEEIVVKSSDFLEYEVDDQVGLLKTYRDGEEGSGGSVGSMGGSGSGSGSVGSVDSGGGSTAGVFNWLDLELQNTGSELNREWVIVPVDFFGTGGSGVGGA